MCLTYLIQLSGLVTISYALNSHFSITFWEKENTRGEFSFNYQSLSYFTMCMNYYFFRRLRRTLIKRCTCIILNNFLKFIFIFFLQHETFLELATFWHWPVETFAQKCKGHVYSIYFWKWIHLTEKGMSFEHFYPSEPPANYSSVDFFKAFSISNHSLYFLLTMTLLKWLLFLN